MIRVEALSRKVVTLPKYNFTDVTSKTCESGSWYKRCINCKEENTTGECIGTIFIHNLTLYTPYQYHYLIECNDFVSYNNRIIESHIGKWAILF